MESSDLLAAMVGIALLVFVVVAPPTAAHRTTDLDDCTPCGPPTEGETHIHPCNQNFGTQSCATIGDPCVKIGDDTVCIFP